MRVQKPTKLYHLKWFHYHSHAMWRILQFRSTKEKEWRGWPRWREWRGKQTEQRFPRIYKNVARVTRISWCLANENSVYENSRFYRSFLLTTRCSGKGLSYPVLVSHSIVTSRLHISFRTMDNIHLNRELLCPRQHRMCWTCVSKLQFTSGKDFKDYHHLNNIIITNPDIG